MINRAFFFSHAKQTLFSGKYKQSQVDGLNAILDEWEKNYYEKDDRWLAYMLATAHHETDRRMQPIEEYGKGKNRRYGLRYKMNGMRYTDTSNIFYGRGFVQLTWYENYEKAGKKLGVDLIKNADKALDLKIATQIMFLGMMEGWFTGKRLSNYFNSTTEDVYNARRIINGTDKASLIADYAFTYYSCISYST